ncbi:hypothetical protein GCM10022205_04120 [Spinactinospora alkalitolerans]
MTVGIRAISSACVSGEWVTDIGTSESERHLPATLQQDLDLDKTWGPAFTLLSIDRFLANGSHAVGGAVTSPNAVPDTPKRGIPCGMPRSVRKADRREAVGCAVGFPPSTAAQLSRRCVRSR